MVLVVKNLPANAGDLKRCGLNPWIRKISWRRVWQPTPVFLPGESLGQRNLAGYRPQGHKGLDTTEATYHACSRSIAHIYYQVREFPGSSDSKASAYNVGDPGSIPGLGINTY